MKRIVLLSISCLFLSLLFSSSASAAVQLVKVYSTMPLRVGESMQIEIRSTDTLIYDLYVGFDSGTAPLGALTDPVVYAEAGSMATAAPVSAPPVNGFYVYAGGTGRAAGLHFSFTYTPHTPGQTLLKLYDGNSSLLNSFDIVVEPMQMGAGFSYQGRLLDDNQPADGSYDLAFTLFDAPSQGNLIGDDITFENVQVVDGYFTVTLDFGDIFGEDAPWLETKVRPGDSTGDYTTLTPRQRLTPTPQAVYADKSNWNKLIDMPLCFADGIDNEGLMTESDPTVPASIKDGLSWSEILGIPAGFADGVDSGLLTETDPTVPASIKDGLSWSEISSVPAGFADGVDNDTTLSETQIEGFIANDITSGYVPYDNGTKLTSSALYTNGQETAIGSAVYPDRKLSILTNSDLYGLYSENTKTTGANYGIVGASTGNTTDSSYGLFGASLSPSCTNYGVYGTATTNSTGTNYGVYGYAVNSGGIAYAGYFNGDVRITTILNRDYDLQIAADAGAETAIGSGIYSDRKLNVSTNSDLYGFYSDNAKTSGNNFAIVGAATGNTTGYSYGVYGTSTSNSGFNYGIRGEATTATPQTNYGVYGYAVNSTGTAYAGYFNGDVRITNILNKDYDLQVATDAVAEVAIGTSVDSNRKLNVRTDADTYGIYSENATGAYSENYGVYGITTGSTGGISCGVFGKSTSGAGNNYGVRGEASTPNTGANLGVYGYASNSGGGYAFAGYFDGDMVTTGSAAIGSDPYSNRKLNISSSSTSVGYGIYTTISGGNQVAGGSKYGVYSSCSGSVCSNFGVYGRATADTPYNNYGVYGYAANSGGGWAWAGYFDGNVYVGGTMSAATIIDRTPYPKDLQTAYSAVMSMERLPDGQYKEDNKEQQLDHSKLSPFIQSQDGHRDLSAAVSCQNEVLKDLIKQNRELLKQNQELMNRLAVVEAAISKQNAGGGK